MATSRATQQSPRSPVGGVASVHLPNEQQQQPPPHQHPMRSTSQGRVTPPVPQASHSVPPAQGAPISKAPQTRGTSPGALVSQPPLGSAAASGGAQQPTRASSAPRAQGISQHHGGPQAIGSNVRTASQPMQASAHARQPGPPGAPGGYPGHLPGPSSPTSPMVPGPSVGQNPHFGHVPQSALVFPASPAIRGASPAPTQVGGIPMPLRGTLGGHAGAARNPSPIGLNSPAGNVCVGQMPFGSVSAAPGHRPDLLSATTRGRSPPPIAATGSTSGPTAVRQPRAVTPSSLVKGITQGIHAAGMVQRGSLGGAAGIHRGM